MVACMMSFLWFGERLMRFWKKRKHPPHLVFMLAKRSITEKNGGRCWTDSKTVMKVKTMKSYIYIYDIIKMFHITNFSGFFFFPKFGQLYVDSRLFWFDWLLRTMTSLVGLLSVGRIVMASMGTAPVCFVRSFWPLTQPWSWEKSLSLMSMMSSPFLKLRNVASSGEDWKTTEKSVS